ncbi:MAG TPA: bifunctional riboflavin kinase/FAD synthetase [Nevskiaceae bacterium]|nr:bifunctional riboflavin kinase/FAD synthetase [Nevskiaceae bacterium]
MELIRGLHNLRERHRGCVLTIGNFDGVHRAHQALIARTREYGRRLGLPVACFTFNPTAREFFDRANAPPRISTLRSKVHALETAGVDRLLIARFHQGLATIGAEAFVTELLVKGLGVRAVVVGDDARFGSRRQGNFDLLQKLGKQYGYESERLPAIEIGGERCSSSSVREALGQADLARAEALLGRPYTVRGRVRRGLQLGRKLDMPTANIPLPRHRLALRQGIYAVLATCEGRTFRGVANLGVRPTLGLTQCLLETHVFEPPGDLYGRVLDVEFRAFLRPELKFDSLDALKKQMHDDAAQAAAVLAA